MLIALRLIAAPALQDVGITDVISGGALAVVLGLLLTRQLVTGAELTRVVRERDECQAKLDTRLDERRAMNEQAYTALASAAAAVERSTELARDLAVGDGRRRGN